MPPTRTEPSAGVSPGRLSYSDEGHGAPVLMLAGAPADTGSYARLAARLRGSHRVLIPDLPGFGDSPALPDPLRLSAMAEAVVEFCVDLNLEDVTLVVNDSAGCIGLGAAARMPERIARVVPISTVAFDLDGRFVLVRAMLRYVVNSLPVRWLNRRFNMIPWAVATLAPCRNPQSGAERRAQLDAFADAAARDRVLDVFAQMALDRDYMASVEAGIALHLRHKPCLLVYGQFDPMRLIGAHRRLARSFAQSTLCIVPREEHFPQIGSADDVADALLRWIAMTPSHRDDDARAA